MSAKSKTTILFDLDGTLIDSVPDLSGSINHMLTKLNRKSFDDNMIHHWVGNGAQMLVSRALAGKRDIKCEIDSSLLDEAMDIFLSHYKENLCVDTYLYDGVKDTLKKLKGLEYQIVIVTNKPVEFVQPIVCRLGIGEYIDYFIGGNSLPTKKPDPAPLLHICEYFDIEIDKCVMIGDSKNDILAARACAMDSIAVSYGYNYGEDISIYEPDFIVDSFADIMLIITGKTNA